VSDERGLRIRLLGNLAASYDGVAVDLGGPQQRAVLAMLVLYRDRGSATTGSSNTFGTTSHQPGPCPRSRLTYPISAVGSNRRPPRAPAQA
jgi:hypothetical protein